MTNLFSPNSSKPVTAALSTVAALVIVGLAFLAGRFVGRRDGSEKAVPTASSTASPVSSTALARPSDPGDVTSQEDFAAATAGWETYRSEDLGFSFMYPSDWKITLEQDDPSLPSPGRSDADNSFVELMPARAWHDWIVRPGASEKSSAIGPVSVECQRSAGTLEGDAATYRGDGDATGAGYVTLRSGERSFYVLSKVLPVQTFFAASGSVECSLSKATTDASSYSKEEDAVGMGIINSFRFESQR